MGDNKQSNDNQASFEEWLSCNKRRYAIEYNQSLIDYQNKNRIDFTDEAAQEIAILYENFLQKSISLDTLKEAISKYGIDLNAPKSEKCCLLYWELYKKAVELNLITSKKYFFRWVMIHLKKTINKTNLANCEEMVRYICLKKITAFNEFLLYPKNLAIMIDFYIEMAIELINNDEAQIAETTCNLIKQAMNCLAKEVKPAKIARIANLIPLMLAKRMLTCILYFEDIFKNSPLYTIWQQAYLQAPLEVISLRDGDEIIDVTIDPGQSESN